MKKILALLIILCLLFVMTACADASIDDEEEASEAIEDVSGDVAELSDSLEDINDDLG